MKSSNPIFARSAALVALWIAVAFLGTGCRHQSDADAIRAGIREHLVSLKTLDLNAMDFNIAQLEIHGDQAEAQTEFRPKAGAPPGAEMRVTYLLEKRNGDWVVLKTQAVGGVIEHPAAGANPHQAVQPGAPQGLPNFHDLLPPANPGASPALPPGHPPVNPPASPKTSATKKTP
jgi:hypothetical protein